MEALWHNNNNHRSYFGSQKMRYLSGLIAPVMFVFPGFPTVFETQLVDSSHIPADIEKRTFASAIDECDVVLSQLRTEGAVDIKSLDRGEYDEVLARSEQRLGRLRVIREQALPASNSTKEASQEQINLQQETLADQTLKLATRDCIKDTWMIQAAGEKPLESVTLSNLAIDLNRLGETAQKINRKGKEALDFYSRAIAISQQIGDINEESKVLIDIGLLKGRRNNLSKAKVDLQRSLDLQQQMGSRSNRAHLLTGLALVDGESNNLDKAFSLLQQALSLHQELGNHPGEATVLFQLATLYESQDRLREALMAVDGAINKIESLRTGIRASELKTSYFATVQDYYHLKTDLLMKLGQPEAAFDANESARARTLTELLNEANVDIRQGVDSSLLTKEKALQNDLQQLESRRISLLSGEHTPAEENALDAESNRLLQQLDQIIAQIRDSSPAYADLVAPQPLSMSAAQQVLDTDTVLVQYALGKEQSYLWLVSQDQHQVYTLPSEHSIQAEAKKFRNVLTKKGNNSDVKRSGDALMSQILPERPEWLEGKRLLIVGDDILSEIPFAALPLPNHPAYVPLLHRARSFKPALYYRR